MFGIKREVPGSQMTLDLMGKDLVFGGGKSLKIEDK